MLVDSSKDEGHLKKTTKSRAKAAIDQQKQVFPRRLEK
jgi:hypothetical protein